MRQGLFGRAELTDAHLERFIERFPGGGDVTAFRQSWRWGMEATPVLVVIAPVDPKVAADQRGHNIGVAIDTYTKTDNRGRLEAVTKLEMR